LSITTRGDNVFLVQDMSRRDDEIASVRAIYEGSDLLIEIKETVVKVVVHSLTAVFTLPSGYPETEPPTLQITVGGADVTRSDAELMRGLSAELEVLLENEQHNEVLFPAIELIRSRVVERTKAAPDVHLLRDTPPLPAPPTTTKLTIFHSEPLVERKSVFISHFAFVTTMEEVREFRAFLLADKKLSRATHNIFCYRFTAPSGAVHSDCDDDGETAAGSRLGEMVRLMSLSRGVAVMVSRWFGGVLLGPSRFGLICNAARVLLEKHTS